jgi:hypothetical protein
MATSRRIDESAINGSQGFAVAKGSMTTRAPRLLIGRSTWDLGVGQVTASIEISTEVTETDWAAWTATTDVMSEMDWMRFWWRFLSDQATAQPTLAQILGFTAFVEGGPTPWTTTQVWPQLSSNVEAAGSPLAGFGQRFTDLADEEGVSP